jgi:hypothetical protein
MIRGALFRIEIKQRGPSCELVIRAGGQRLRIPSARWEQIPEARKAVRRSLDDFLSAVGEGLTITNWLMVDEALYELEKSGNALLFSLLGGEGTRRLAEYLSKHAPFLLKTVPYRGGPIPAIELDSAGDYLHFEVLPFLSLDGWRRVKGQDSLRQAMARFLGMSAIIRRTSLKQPWQDLHLKNPGRLPIKVFRDASLPGSEMEHKFFEDRADRIDVDGPWPTAALPAEEFSSRLASFLANPSVTFSGVDRDPIDQIHHISCHCYMGSHLSNEAYLEFSSEGGSYTASIRDLQAAYSQIFRSLPRDRAAPPLAFLNACSSVSVDLLELSSFPDLLLESHRGVIGTETRIPDAVAAEFSAAFYRSLLDGRSVGQSVHDARWYLVNQHSNPLGIVYTLYADPNLHLAEDVELGGAHG